MDCFPARNGVEFLNPDKCILILFSHLHRHYGYGTFVTILNESLIAEVATLADFHSVESVLPCIVNDSSLLPASRPSSMLHPWLSTPSRFKLLPPLTFYIMFDHSSYLKY
jgi:hypothetical protein